ncbi:MAG: SDR family NAD(P)-dependent oxidoreductase [Chloroflexi bacterium]|nr:SDR family NAD(P)-dependent oxidoreductase [Chloroflexota bacterium]
MKHAFIAGGSSPIGMAAARELAARGLHVTIHANTNTAKAREAAAQIIESGGAADTLTLDLRSPGALEVLANMAITSPFQVFVHCVGGQRDVPFAAMSAEDWHDIVDLNLNTFFAALRPIITPMIRGRWGRVIAVSSLTAVTGNRGQSNYAAAKGGMHALVKSLTREYASRGITANVVAPGVIETAKTSALENYDELRKLSPSGRAGTPEEVASLIGFLASEEAGYISGQLIAIDGGTS